MENYSTAPINSELQKALSGVENNLEVEVSNLVKQFQAYQEKFHTYQAQSLVLDKEVDRLVAATQSMTKVIGMIKEILYADAKPEAIVKLLQEQVK